MNRAMPMPMLASSPTVYQLAEEEWSLHARCIASGLPPFPTSMCGYSSQRRHLLSTEIGPLFPSDQSSSFTLDANPLQQQMTMTMMIPLDRIQMKPPTVPFSSSPSRSVQKRKLPAAFWNGTEIFNPAKNPASKAARVRRKNISDRTTILASLMPWERRMSISTMLEEAKKYVKFLEAQVMAVQYMPVESYFHCDSPISGAGGSRQQLMQVLVNSRIVQERLYDKGLCVYSVEQMILMRRIVEREMVVQKQQHMAQKQSTGSSTTTS